MALEQDALGKTGITPEKSELPPVGRCFECGRFMKRGLLNWIDHIENSCPVGPAMPLQPPVKRQPFEWWMGIEFKKKLDEACGKALDQTNGSNTN